MKRIALALAFALGGCSPIADRCHDDTLLVSVTLDDATAAADSFDVSISIDGAAPVQTTVAHTPGTAAGNLVVTFPHGYPRGHTVAVDVEALVAGNVVGTGSASQPLVGSCEVAPLSIAAASAGDLGVADLATGDLAGAAADLAPPADMVCVPTAETGNACFDGVDNDCDGHIDCDDPDCNAIAQCVPTPSAGFVLGIAVAQSSFCPGMFVQQEVINEGLNPASPQCPTNACTCNGVMGCNGAIHSFDNDSSCSGEEEDVSADSTCRNWNVNQTTGSVMSSVIVTGSAQCVKGGSSTHGSVSWTTSDNFCKTTAIGGGCMPGNSCVPLLAAAKICELSDGTPACDGGYNAFGGPWFHDFSDARTCTCNCGSATGGACGNTYTIYSDNNCGTTVTTVAQNQMSCVTESGANFHTVKITGGTAPGCGAPTTTVGGTVAGTGTKTICCRP